MHGTRMSAQGKIRSNDDEARNVLTDQEEAYQFEIMTGQAQRYTPLGTTD
jgi:hypothetical protein